MHIYNEFITLNQVLLCVKCDYTLQEVKTKGKRINLTPACKQTSLPV